VRCASIAIGIVAYDDRQLRVDHAELRYAVGDARAFHRYVSLAWPAAETNSVHLELLEGQASKPSIETAFRQLSGAGEFDLAIVYLSGHGEREPYGSGWFCAADAASGHRSLDGPSLNSLLALVQASSVLMLVDCCYAEATTADMGSP
jgi:hypothetical protein